ncbi:unnamed protein product [Umbelopsis ramanniana]
MDVGNLKQPYGKSSEKHPLGKGLFKVGDYDDDQIPIPLQRAMSGYDKVTGHHHKDDAATATTNTATPTATAPAPAAENKQ